MALFRRFFLTLRIYLLCWCWCLSEVRTLLFILILLFRQKKFSFYTTHCSALCSVSVCFWAFWIWIREYFVRILPSISKTINKNLVFCCSVTALLGDFLSLKTDVNVPTESNKQNKLEKNLFFVSILEVTDEKSRIRSWIWIRKSNVLIRGSGSVLKCLGSGTGVLYDLDVARNLFI
jgi:hypothetical protein